MKEGAIIHLVLTRSCDLVEPHVPSRSARQRGVNSDDTLYLDLQCKSQGQAPAPFHGYPEGGDPLFPAHIFQYPSDSAANGSLPLREPPIRAANGCFRNTT